MDKNLVFWQEMSLTAEKLEEMLLQGEALTAVPVRPLYMAIKELPPQMAAYFLPAMSPEQRQIFLDLDLWRKDELDVDEFSYWVQAYHACEDFSVKEEFVKTSQFSFFLKGRFNIWTFDVEDPQYPDHDNYFLTDDNLLLFEFDPDCPFVQEIKQLIIVLYGELGVENAYAHLFKMVVDSFSSAEEEEYRWKKERLKDHGFVDYFDAIEYRSTFPTLASLNNFIKHKQDITGHQDFKIDDMGLDAKSLAPYRRGMDGIQDEFAKVENDVHRQFLSFNFARLVNASLTLSDALKKDALTISAVGSRVKFVMLLGFDYIKMVLEGKCEGSIFNRFTFQDFFKVGQTLTTLEQKKIKKAISTTFLHLNPDDDKFLGKMLSDFMNTCFSEKVQFFDIKTQKHWDLDKVDVYYHWVEQVDFFVQILPFVHSMRENFIALKDQGRLQDMFYLNYMVDEIDFEAILMSSFANFSIGTLSEENPSKMGLSVSEYKVFFAKMCSNGKDLDSFETPSMAQMLSDFSKRFGFEALSFMAHYLYALLDSQVGGQDLTSLKEEEFKYVGGPILLKGTKTVS